MPNWCHQTLWVSGDPEELAVFIAAAKPKSDVLRRQWDEGPPTYMKEDFRDNYESFEQWEREVVEANPLSFESIVPQPSDEELRKLETYGTCRLCGGSGKRPCTREEAEEKGADWDDSWAEFEWLPTQERCNGCSGTGEERTSMEGWYEWRCENWGCKWDASFDGPGIFAVQTDEGVDVDLSVESQGVLVAADTAVYKFDTPWAPPIPFVEAASARYPSLTFVLYYAEPGMGFAGQVEFEAGERSFEADLPVEDVLAPEDRWF